MPLFHFKLVLNINLGNSRKNNVFNSFLNSANSYKYEYEETKGNSIFSTLFFMDILLNIFVNIIPNVCSGNATWILFILGITVSDYRNLLGYFRNILFFGLNGIHLTNLYKKHTRITKQTINTHKLNTISNKNIALLFLIMCHFEKHHILQYQQEAKFFKNNRNYSYVPLLWLNDNEIIMDSGLGCENESIGQGRSYEDKNISITNCFFSRYLQFYDDGGVIYVNSHSCSMNINCSIFYSCFAWRGGAIYFSSTISNLRMICANRCNGNYYHFAYLYAFQVNHVDYLSISNCSHMKSGYYSFCLNDGNQRVYNTNSSMNKAVYISSIFIENTPSFISSHCTFSNNQVVSGICIQISSGSGTISMSYANIVHNNSPSMYGVLCVSDAETMIFYCIFHNNHEYLFYVESGSLEVSHSFIDHTSSFSTELEISTSNNSLTNRITYQIQFFNSLHCYADIPLPHGTFEKSVMRSLEETHRITNEKTIRRTIDGTLRKTYERTIDETMKETPKETIHRSYSEIICSNRIVDKRKVSLIFSFSFFYPVIILMIL